MHKKFNIRMILLIAVILASFMALSAQTRQIELSTSANQALLKNNSDLGFDVQYNVGELKLREIQTKEGAFDELSIEGWGFTNAVGEPKLPMLRQMIAVPLGAELRATITSQSGRELDNISSKLQNRIIPAQEPVSKSSDPATLPFVVKDDIYSRDGYNSRDWVQVTDLGIMRGVRVFALDFFPVRYDPVNKSISVMEAFDVRVEFINPDLLGTADMLAKTASFEFEKLYGQTFFNWNADTRTQLVRYPTKMVILCPTAYTSNIQSYVDWKTEQGFIVNVVTVGSGAMVANTAAAIKTYMQNLWNSATTANPAPTYLLIIGDESGTITVATNTGATESHVTDLTYVRLNGTDYMPEMYHGRFSVSSTTELANIITKTITYEKTLMPDLSYLGKTVLIAGADASWAPTHGNGAINYATAEYFNSAHGITSNNYLYPASQTSDAVIIANANEGRGYINYTAHGGQTSWADPTFTVSDVNAMTNANKYGVMVGNCCITNEFNYSSPCFGEAVIRKANGGGVIYIGGINSTYWNEDYYWAVGYKTPIDGTAPAYNASKLGANDAMFHTHGEASTNWATTTGEAMYMGNMAVQQSGSSRTNYYWEIYHIMGDPSLMTYMGVPTVNNATYPSQILIGATQITVTAAPYSRVALTMGGVIYGTAMVPASGSLNLPITAFTNVGTAKMTITAQNKITLQTNVSIIPNSGPYVSVSSTVYEDSNNNVAEYNEAGRFNVTYQNVGSVTATNVVTTLTCATTGITLTDNSETIASLAAGASTTINNAYKFNIANNVPNGSSAAFTITMVSGSNTWVHNFTQTINAPALVFGNMTVSDPAPGNNDGRLDPGETVTVTMPLNNTGAAASLAGSATLTSPTSGITINTGTASFAAIAAAGSTNLSFNITAASSMTIGTVASLVFNATAGAYTATKTEMPAVGLILEDFETGNFNSFSWIQSTIPWTIVNTGAHTGTYAAKSGVIPAYGSTTMETTRILSTPGNLTFWYKVSSETNYDKLKFYIDGVLQGTGWSGTVDWTQATYPLTVGTRTLKWEYMKDVSVDTGSDCAWVDDIIFPASTAPSSFYPPRNLTATAGNGFVNLAWQAPLTGTATGYKIFRNSTLLTAVTGLSYRDNAVVNETTYSYYLKAAYGANESDPTDTVTATPTAIVPTTVIIGTGTDSGSTSTACPINVYWQSLHGQSVYTAAELNALGVVGPINISQIGFNVTGLPTKVMPNYLIRMGHTTAVDVGSWISTGLSTVWTSASYQPTTTGWNMLTLSTPFLWNGSDNIVIDTAFGVIGSYNSSGTTQYTTVTNGYRYGRSDSVDQTNLFTGTYTSTNRPNVKLALLPNASGPMIVANPTTLSYGDVAVGTNSVQQFTILNGGNQTLTGTITTPTGYTVSLAAGRSEQFGILTDKDSRNTLSFNVNAGASKTYNLTLAPTAAIAYNGNVVIASNAVNSATVNLAVTGAGFIPPIINIDNNALYANLQVGNEGTDSFTITNTGSQTLTYEISLAELRGISEQPALGSAKGDRSIAGSTLTLSALEYMPGTTQNWTFTVYNGSTDTEWLKDVIVSFPTGVTVNSVTNFVGGSGGDLVADNTSGNGITIDWYGAGSNGFGFIYGNGTATATVNVSIASSFGGTMSLPYQIIGDDYNAEPHTLTGTLTVPQAIPPVEWLSVQPLSGSIPAGQSQLITGYFSAIGMAVGSYEAMLTIYSNDPVNPSMEVSATMDVWDNGNHAPTINLPAILAFDRNGSLEENFNSYVTDEDLDPLTLAYSGNTNINVAINGLNVTFTALVNWTGTETITFSVYDGYTYAYDSVQVTVNAVTGPDWVPVIYPNNSATVYGKVTIYGVAGQLNDVIGAFVGTECRGRADVVVNSGNAYITILVNLASNGENVSFKIYDYSENVIYDALETYNLNFGQVLGTSAAPVPISYLDHSATVYGIVTINGIAGQINDVISAFVGNECRGVADVVVMGGNAYVTIVVNLASQGETVSFKIYDYSADVTYDALETYNLNFGQVLGTSAAPVPISISEIVELDQPVVTVTRTSTGTKLTWQSVEHADVYQVYRSTDPYGNYGVTPIATVNAPGTTWEDTQILPMAFYKVIAVKN